MKKSPLPAVFIFALLLSACVKHELIPGNTVNYCPITSITFDNNEFGLTDTLTFHYNPDGSPSRIDRAFVDDGSPKYIFRYDKDGRLLDFIGALDNGSAEFWTRFYYDEGSRTILDTSYTEARQYLTWPPQFFGDAEKEIRHFDELGRVVDYEFFLIPSTGTGPNFSQPYSYTRTGDLPNLTYDNKINYHRTNRVWQLIDNNYTNNNLPPITRYNDFGLPTEIDNPAQPFLFGLGFPNVRIHYACDAPNKK